MSVAGTIGIAIGHHGFPGPVDVWLFIVGAGLGFAVMVAASRAHTEPTNRPISVTGSALLNLTPVFVVPVASASEWWIPDNALAFGVAGLATTVLYVGGQALVLVLLHRVSSRRISEPEPERPIS